MVYSLFCEKDLGDFTQKCACVLYMQNMNTRQIHSKKSNNKTKRNKTNKTNRVLRSSKNGGEFLGKGTFGDVYGGPRLPCVGETVEQVRGLNEASKIFKDDKYAEEEFNVVERINAKFSPEEIAELNKHAILPKQLCHVNRTLLSHEPYSTEEWKKNKAGEYNDQIFNGSRQLTEHADGYNQMVIQPLGQANLKDVFGKIQSDEYFMDCIVRLLNIAKGIQLLQQKQFIHGDIKDANCILVGYQFKLIDMTDVRFIPDTEDVKSMPYAMMYYIWPLISAYTVFFDKRQFPRLTDPSQINMDGRLFSDLYANQRGYNELMYRVYVPQSFGSYEDILLNGPLYGFSAEDVRKLMRQKEVLWDEKMGIEENLLDDTFDKFNAIYQKFESLEEVKLDIFKRIDVYSFGILILSCIHNYLLWKKRQVNKKIAKRPRNMILKLFDIVYMCCKQNETVANIDDIVNQYMREIIGRYYWNSGEEESTRPRRRSAKLKKQSAKLKKR